ncbi:hypothetical protein [Microbacterium sp. A94]|uniref:hypothetical protein n=1 Tax=Microbacterium sp. A94 TaxID=3450717 RepID=UPI003F43D985
MGSMENEASVPDKILFSNLDDFSSTSSLGKHRWSGALSRGMSLEAFGLNQGSDVLIVSLHGATDRKKYSLPRFERFATLKETEYSSLYFSDPTLGLSRDLELGWYTGWRGINVHYWLAEWANRVASAFGCSKIVFCGSSGGGFASLQASSYLPGSIAVPFNPQTSVNMYLVDGERDHAQRRYYQYVYPELIPGGWAGRDPGKDWTETLSGLTSAVRKYETPLANYVFYVQNKNDYIHVRDHKTPFIECVSSVNSESHLKSHFYFDEYDGPAGHIVPDRPLYLNSIARALRWHQDVSAMRTGRL